MPRSIKQIDNDLFIIKTHSQISVLINNDSILKNIDIIDHKDNGSGNTDKL